MTTTFAEMDWISVPPIYNDGTAFSPEIADGIVNDREIILSRCIDLTDTDREWVLVATTPDGDETDDYARLCHLLDTDDGPTWDAEVDNWAITARAALYGLEETAVPADAHRTTFDLHNTFGKVYRRYEVVWLAKTVRTRRNGDPIDVWGGGDCPVRVTRSAVTNAEVLTHYPEQVAGDWEVVVEPRRVLRAVDLEAGCYMLRRLD